MTHEEMLAHLGLTEGELRDLAVKKRAFLASLSDAQRNVYQATVKIPSFAEAAASFGRDFSESDLQKFLELRAGVSPAEATVLCIFYLTVNQY